MSGDSPSFDERRDCPEAIQHGPADGRGRCPWCRRRYTRAVVVCVPYRGTTDLTQAYRRTYDPDWGVSPADIDI